MKVAAIYDIHGNLPALEAVLADIDREGVDQIVVGGDVVPGPMPCGALDALTRLGTPTDFIRGNGEREVIALVEGRETTSVPRHRGTRWRTNYDLNEAAARIRETDYPEAIDFAEGSVLRPPVAADMVAVFERAALGRAERRI